MTRKTTTFRLDSHVQEGLAKLSACLHLSQNQLVNEALGAYIPRRMQEVEHEVEGMLADLRAYRARDPEFQRAIARVADSEAAGVADPAEGEASGQKERAASAAPSMS